MADEDETEDETAALQPATDDSDEETPSEDQHDEETPTPADTQPANPFDVFDEPTQRVKVASASDAYPSAKELVAQGKNPFDVFDSQETMPKVSPLESGVRQGALDIVPSGVGAVAGIAAGTVGTPLVGLPAGVGAYYLTRKGEDWLLDKLGLSDDAFLSKSKREADWQQNPNASFVGSLAGNVLGGGAKLGATVLQRGVGAVLGGGFEAANEYATGQDTNPAHIAEAAGAGALAAMPYSALERAGGKAGATVSEWLKARFAVQKGTATPEQTALAKGPAPNQVPDQADEEIEAVQPAEPGQPGRPDLQQDPAKQTVDRQGNDVPVSGFQATPQPPPSRSAEMNVALKTGDGSGYQTVGSERDLRKDVLKGAGSAGGAPSTEGLQTGFDPALKAALQATINHATGGTNEPAPAAPNPPPVGGRGPVPAPAGGNPPAPAAGAGPDMGASPAGNAGSLPNGVPAKPAPPAQYKENAAKPIEPGGKNPFDQFDSGGIPDFLKRGQDNQLLDQTITEARQRAMRRPIVETPMPTGANSSTDLNGPVYVDPSVPPELRRPVAVHETVEQVLMAEGVPYEQAHKVATQAEMEAVRKAGIDPKKYDEKWGGILDHTEHQPATNLPPDLHVSPEDALGHHRDKYAEAARWAGAGPVGEKIRAQQQGEAFNGPEPPDVIPTGKVARAGKIEEAQPAPAEKLPEQESAPQPKSLEDFAGAMKAKQTEAVTAGGNTEGLNGRDQALIDKLRQMGMDRAADRISALPRTDQIKALNHVADALNTRTLRNVFTRPTSDTGAKQPNQALAAQRNQYMRAAKEAYEKFSPVEGETHVQMEDRLRSAAQYINEQAPGLNYNARANPEKGITIPPYMEWAKQVRYAVGRTGEAPLNRKTFADFPTAEQTIRGGGEDTVRANRMQEQNQVMSKNTGEVENLPLQGAGGQLANELAPPLPDKQTIPHEVGRNSRGDVIPNDPVAKAQNALADWYNALTPEQYETLHNTLYEGEPIGNLNEDIRESQDPATLLRHLKETLDTATKGRPREVPVVAPAPGQPSDVTPLPTTLTGKPKSAPGRTLDRNSPEFAAAAQQALEAVRKQEAKKLGYTPQGEPEKAKVVQRDTADVMHDAAEGVFNRFLNDENATVYLPFLNPRYRMPSQVTDAVQQLRKAFNISDGFIRIGESRLRQLHTAMDQYATDNKIDRQARITMYQKAQRRVPFTPQEQDYYDRFVKPLKDEGETLYQNAQIYNPKLPTEYKNGKVAYVPRVRVPDMSEALNDLPWQRTLSDWSPSLQERDYFALDDGNTRRIFKMNDDGDLVLMTNGRGMKVKNVPPNFSGSPGQSITLKIRGNTSTYKVDHADTPEIMAAVPQLKYTEDLFTAYANNVYDLQRSILKSKLFDRITNDPVVQQFRTTDRDEARALGYKPTILPELATSSKTGLGKPYYYHKNLAWLLDDFSRSGLGTNGTLENIRRWASYFARPLYALSPLFHPMNVGANWAIGTPALVARASSLKQVGGWAQGFIPDLYNSVREVVTQGGNDLNEIRGAGGRLMHDSQLFNNGAIEDMIEKFGEQIGRRPGPWNNAMTSLGMPDVAIDLPRYIMKGSNKVTWALNDMATLSLYKTAKRLGMSPQEATQAVANYIGTYRATENQTFLAGNNIVGRAMQQVVNEPAVSWFGPYHIDLWHTLAHITKNLVDTQAPLMGANRKEAAAAMATLIGITYGVYPYVLDPFVKWLTGNESTELGRRGLSALADIPRLWENSDSRAFTNLGQTVFTPSIPANVAAELPKNLDWNGDKIVLPGAPPGQQAGQVADYMARALVPPYSNVAPLANQNDVTPLGVAKKALERSIGLNEPSESAQKYLNRRDYYNRQDVRKRLKKPRGFIERGLNALTGD